MALSEAIDLSFNLNKSVGRQKDVLALAVKGLGKKCAQLDWSKGLRVMSAFLQSQGAASDDAVFGDPTDEFRFNALASQSL